MSWFDEQIKQRKLTDQEALEDSFMELAGVVLGKSVANKLNNKLTISKYAIDDILKYFQSKPIETKEGIDTFEDALEYILRPYGIMSRNIKLEDDFYKEAYGPILAFTKDRSVPIALIPNLFIGYHYRNPDTNEKVNVNSRNVSNISDEAICFYRPLPLKELGIKDLLIYLKNCITIDDIVLIAISTIITSLISLILPRVSKALTGPVLNSKDFSLLMSIGIFMICITLSTQIFGVVHSFITARISTKTSLAVEAAVMSRLLSLPATFFRKYSSGELSSRANSLNTLASMLMNFVFSLGLTSLSSVLYINQIFNFAPKLVIPALIVIISTIIVSALTSLLQIRISKAQMELAAKGNGLLYALISGIQKIKLAGAEKRAFSKWLSHYAKESEYLYNPPTLLKISNVIIVALSLFGNIVLYYIAIQNGIGQDNYFAFNMSYAMVMGSFSSLANIALSFARVRPILEMAEPILKEKPEVAQDKEILTEIKGRIELNNVSFRYEEKGPYIIDDLSLRIKAGEYVAIVGKTGCGKSTLMRLLLGFEKPTKGAIYYDNKDLETIDLKSLRRKIGTVMQSGGLFRGDILSNIGIAANNLTLEQAWEAAEIAGIAEDIRRMPMGMFTFISEGQGGISGGQKQRLMIARAIAPKPKILMFDEATSALDNVTQKKISDALDKLECTRIVIAHRLSTIKNCDRILVLEDGKIKEEGTYDELIKQNGLFANLVKRQRLDEE